MANHRLAEATLPPEEHAQPEATLGGPAGAPPALPAEPVAVLPEAPPAPPPEELPAELDPSGGRPPAPEESA